MAEQTASGAPAPPPIPETDQGALNSAVGTSASRQDSRGGELTSYRLSTWAVARFTLAVLLVIGAIFLLWKIQEVLLLLLLAIIFATAIEPLVNRLRKGPFSRGQGILIVYSALFLVIALVGFLFVPGLVDEAGRFVETLPDRIVSLRPRVEQITLRPVRELLLRGINQVHPAVQQSLERPAAPSEQEVLVQAGGALVHTLFSLTTVFLLTYYWLTERAAIKRAVLRLAPKSRARQINATWLQVEAKLGGWVRGQLLTMLALGAMSGIAFWLLGLPNPFFLAVLAGLCEIIPMIGPFLAFVPALLVALTVDPTKALLLIPIAIVIQQIEGNVLIPRIMSHTVGVSPLTVILGIMVGSTLYGPAGAFLAVPIAAAIQVILHYSLRPELEDELAPVPIPRAELEGDRPPKRAAVASSPTGE